MALERICDICHESLGVCPEKYWVISITKRERLHERKSNIDMCEDCMNKLIKKEIEK